MWSFSHQAFAQTSVYEDSFCAHYSYSVDCYAYRKNAETKISTFVDLYVKKIKQQPWTQALTNLRNMHDQLETALQYYKNTHWSFLIQFFADQFIEPIAQLEEEISALRLDAAFINQQLSTATSKDAFVWILRRMLISQLITNGFDGFAQRPFASSDASWMITTDKSSEVRVSSPIFAQDALDRYLADAWASVELWTTVDVEFTIPPRLYKQRKGNVFLFKTTEDLQALWYQLVSHRERTNNDDAYRRTNIAQAFDQIGHVRVLNPGDEISYMQDSNFDPYQEELYEYGFAIFNDEEIEDYGWGLCGGSTAIYQGIVTNRSLSRPALRNHSKWYHHLYNATIDGQWIDTPGIDSTIYSNSLDLRMKNISQHPIILVLNYEGWTGESEEVFTIGYASDKWSITYVGSRPYHASLSTKWWGSKKVVGQCHTWNINGENRESCYKEIKS